MEVDPSDEASVLLTAAAGRPTLYSHSAAVRIAHLGEQTGRYADMASAMMAMAVAASKPAPRARAASSSHVPASASAAASASASSVGTLAGGAGAVAPAHAGAADASLSCAAEMVTGCLLTPADRNLLAIAFKNRLTSARGALKMLALVAQYEAAIPGAPMPATVSAAAPAAAEGAVPATTAAFQHVNGNAGTDNRVAREAICMYTAVIEADVRSIVAQVMRVCLALQLPVAEAALDAAAAAAAARATSASDAGSGGAANAPPALPAFTDTAGAPVSVGSAAEAMVFYYKLAADYCRYAAECISDASSTTTSVSAAGALAPSSGASGAASSSSAFSHGMAASNAEAADFAWTATMTVFSDQALAFYSKARAYASLYLHPASPAVLGVTLNFTVFLFEIRRCEAEAYEVAAAALEDAAAALAVDDAIAAAKKAEAEDASTASSGGKAAGTASLSPASSSYRMRSGSKASGGRQRRLRSASSHTSASGGAAAESDRRYPSLTPSERADSTVVQQLIRENLHVWSQVLKVTSLLV